MRPLVCLHPKEIRKTSRREIERFCNFFPDDLDPDSLYSELDLMRSSIEQTCTLREAAQLLVSKWESIPNLCIAYQLALTSPVSVASNERSLSRLKLVKNYLRTLMTHERLVDLMIITCESDITDDLSLDELAEKWSRLKSRRMKI